MHHHATACLVPQALVDGFASNAGAEKLKGLPAGSDVSKLQAELLKATGWVGRLRCAVPLASCLPAVVAAALRLKCPPPAIAEASIAPPAQRDVVHTAREPRAALSSFQTRVPANLPSFAPARSTADCANAKTLQLTSAPCLCNATAPYLHCHALAAKEAAAKLQSTLGVCDLVVDLGGCGCVWAERALRLA